jgi:hypothetical protein
MCKLLIISKLYNAWGSSLIISTSAFLWSPHIAVFCYQSSYGQQGASKARSHLTGWWRSVRGLAVIIITRILYCGRLFYYPIKPCNALRNLGVVEACRCMGSYLAQKFCAGRDDGVDGTFEQRVTRRLFEIFFKIYSEKLWGIGCHELDADFAA